MKYVKNYFYKVTFLRHFLFAIKDIINCDINEFCSYHINASVFNLTIIRKTLSDVTPYDSLQSRRNIICYLR